MKFSKLLLAGAVLTLSVACNRDGRKLSRPTPLNLGEKQVVKPVAPIGDDAFVGPLQAAPVADATTPAITSDFSDILSSYSEDKSVIDNLTAGAADVSNCKLSSCDGLWKLVQVRCDSDVVPSTKLLTALTSMNIVGENVTANYINGDKREFSMISDDNFVTLTTKSDLLSDLSRPVGFTDNILTFGSYKYTHSMSTSSNYMILGNSDINTVCEPGQLEVSFFQK